MIVTLVAGPDRATVDATAGGRLASLLAGGRERLVDHPQRGSSLEATSWGSFMMAPWVGRIGGGRLEWRGRQSRLPVNDGGHAIHGATFDVPWRVERHDRASVELSAAIASTRWPFGGRAWQRLSLGRGSLRFEASVSATESMPVALGWHPWFRRGPADLAVTVRADRRLELDGRLIPTGASLPVVGPADLRRGPLLGDRRLDDVYVDARSPAIVRWPDLELRIEFEPPVGSVVVFTPPGAACVEPATSWPGAIGLAAAGATGTGLVELEAGGSLVATMTWRW